MRAFLASEQRGHSHALAPLHRYSFQPTVTASQALPEGTTVEPRPRGVVTVRRTIACQLNRFALGADFEGVDAHAPFPMMAVVAGGQQKPAALSAGAAGKLLNSREGFFRLGPSSFVSRSPSSKLFNIAHLRLGFSRWDRRSRPGQRKSPPLARWRAESSGARITRGERRPVV